MPDRGAIRRWGGYLALVIVFAVACGFLASWQWDRRTSAVAAIELVENNWDAPAVPLSSLVPELDDWSAELTWRPVEVTGHYLHEHQLLVRNRVQNGQIGFEVLVPLLLEDGSVFVVDRGWVPTGSAQDDPDILPAAPDGEVTVVARLRAGEPTLPGRSAPDGQIATVHLPSVADAVDAASYTGAYGLRVSESPAPASAPLARARPEADEGPHLSYALQWVAFAVLGFIGLGWAIRQERRAAREDDEDEPRPAKKRKLSDAEIEDALIDQLQ